MSENSEERLIISDHGGIREIAINRPAKRNALDLSMKAALVGAFHDADTDDSVKVIVITGSITVFVSGTDIAELATLTPTDHLLRGTGDVFSRLDAVSKPTISAVEGYALGGGCELALASDIVVAGSGAQFGQPEIQVGLIPGAGGINRLVRIAGRQRAMRMLLTGDRIAAPEAQAMGIVSEVVDDGKALKHALSIAARILAMSSLSAALIKEVARDAEESPLRAGLLHEKRTFQVLFDSQDHREGLSAYLDHRSPCFEGR